MLLSNYEEIVSHECSPILVLAGPGFGKTYLLADKVKRLLNKGVNKKNITIITFGKDASQNMKDMLIDDFELNIAELPHISTMHSLGNSIVREKPKEVNLLKTNLEVQEDEKVKKLLYRDAAYMLGFDDNDAKNARKCKEYGDCQNDENRDKCKICLKYREIMSKCNYIDFDDQIIFANEILINNEDILEKYQGQSQHLLVDEYQDINAAQFHLIELLSRKSRNGLFVVGDDAQSIYGFRGCDPKYIRKFKGDYPDAKLATLNSSRRCHKNILEDAFKILETYYEDWSGKPDNLEYIAKLGVEPKLYQASSEEVEAKLVANIAIKALKNKNSVLVLAPKKEFFPSIINKLEGRGIPCNCSYNFLPEKISIIKKFSKWLKNSNDNFIIRVLIEYLINHGNSKILGASKNLKVCKKETIENRKEEEIKIANLWESVNKRKSLYSLLNSDEEDKTLSSLNEAFRNLYSLYEKYHKRDKGDFLKHLSCISDIWCEPKNFIKDIITVTELLKAKKYRVSNTVKITTMRKAKGLSYDVVIIVGLEDDIVPSSSENLIEEARLFYVSITRAAQELYLIHSYKRPRNISYGKEIIKKQRSRFLEALNRSSIWIK